MYKKSLVNIEAVTRRRKKAKSRSYGGIADKASQESGTSTSSGTHTHMDVGDIILL